MGKYLDLAGLEHVMQSIQQKLRRKQDALSPDASITIQDNTIGVTTPVRGVTQKEYDALPEEEKAKGMYVITDAAPTIGGGTGGGSVEEVYSTEEQRIGTWIDGKPLYRRAYELTSRASGSGESVLFQQNDISTLVKSYGTMIDSANAQVTIPFVYGTNSQMSVWIDANKNVRMYNSGGVYLNRPMVLILEYTKTTDPAPTGIRED